MVVGALFKIHVANVLLCIMNFLIDRIKMQYANHDIAYERMSKEVETVDEINNLKFVELKVEVLYYDDRFCVPKFGEHRLNIMNNLCDI